MFSVYSSSSCSYELTNVIFLTPLLHYIWMSFGQPPESGYSLWPRNVTNYSSNNPNTS